MKTEVKDRQSLLDIALQVCGSIEAVMSIAVRNGVSVTDDLTAGTLLEYEPEDVVDKRVVEIYRREGIEPATSLSREDMEALSQEGIGFMAVETDFIIS